MKRWEKAQEKEREYWKQWKENIVKHRKNASYLWNYHKHQLETFVKLTDETNILEIGGGPAPFIAALPGKRYGIDTLMDFYKTFDLPTGVEYINASGENIPFKDGFFDIAISTNVLDHLAEPVNMINEINRVLKIGGIMYITVDCYNPMVRFYRKFRELVGLGDRCHPNTFSVDDISRMIKSHGFNVLMTKPAIAKLGNVIYMDGKKEKLNIFGWLNKTAMKILSTKYDNEYIFLGVKYEDIKNISK